LSAPQLFHQLHPAAQRALRRAFTDGVPVDDPRSVDVDPDAVEVLAGDGLLVRRTSVRKIRGRSHTRRLWRTTAQGREVLGITHRQHAAERFRELTDAGQRALRIAETQGIPVEKPRSVGVQRRTAEMLEQDGILAQRTSKKRARMWRPTSRGRALLHAHEPRLLHQTIGYTDDPGRAMPNELEAVDEAVLASNRRAAHDVEHNAFDQVLDALARRPLHERLRLAAAAAAARGVDVADDSDFRLIQRKLRDIEKRVHQPADRFADAEPLDP
jgi:hypothetical protein